MSAIPNLPSLVRDKFKLARMTGELKFYETQVSILQCDGIPFQVRFSPALANKPKSNKSHDPNEKPVDPFSNPKEGLLVSTGFDSHFIILNKFPVIPDHFILATKEYKLQTCLLGEVDIAAAYQCLMSFRDNGEELFGFFNSGDYSGASQPHRHIQFLPVESMKAGVDEKESWEVLANTLATKNPPMPFTYFTAEIKEGVTSGQLHAIYIDLHNKACLVSGKLAIGGSEEMESPISYNLALTSSAMIICPRTCEGIYIESIDGERVGPVSLNGTVLGGTLLVKSEAEWVSLRYDKSKLKDVLNSIGINPFDTRHGGKI